MLIHDRHVRVIYAATSELIRELTLDPIRNYQPTGTPSGPKPRRPGPNEGSGPFLWSERSHGWS